MRFSSFTSSNEYNVYWTNFNKKLGISGSPILCFYITYHFLILS
jgi:hypothetical protein